MKSAFLLLSRLTRHIPPVSPARHTLSCEGEGFGDGMMLRMFLGRKVLDIHLDPADMEKHPDVLQLEVLDIIAASGLVDAWLNPVYPVEVVLPKEET